MVFVTVIDRKSLYTLIGKVETRDSKSIRFIFNDLLEPYKEDCHIVTADALRTASFSTISTRT